MRKTHPSCKTALLAEARTKKAADLKSQMLFTFGAMPDVKHQNGEGESSLLEQPGIKKSCPFVLTTRQRELSSQVT